MQCPVCKVHSLEQHLLEENFTALACRQCAGYWIAGAPYWNWLENGAPDLPEKSPEQGLALAVTESGDAKLCPTCGRLLIRYKVGHGTTFHVERCGQCAGMWFHANAWEILRSRNLHRHIHLVSSDGWRAAVETDERQAAFEQIMLQKLGPADLDEIRRIKAWIDRHPRRNELHAFLMNQPTLD